MFRLQRSEKDENVIDGKVSRFLTVNGPSEEHTQPKRREAVADFWASSKMKTRTRHTISTTVLEVEKESVRQDPLTLVDSSKTTKRQVSVKSAPKRQRVLSRAFITTKRDEQFGILNWTSPYRESSQIDSVRKLAVLAADGE